MISTYVQYTDTYHTLPMLRIPMKMDNRKHKKNTEWYISDIVNRNEKDSVMREASGQQTRIAYQKQN